MAEPLMRQFVELVTASFGEALAPYGFGCESGAFDEYLASVTFGNADRHVEVSANVHPRDHPPYFNVNVGEGSLDFIEWDWSSVPLWRIQNLIAGDGTASEYSLEAPVELSELVARARDDLLEFGVGFLDGDLRVYRKARSEQNAGRPPYKVYTPDKSGCYVETDEPDSVRMKEQYS